MLVCDAKLLLVVFGNVISGIYCYTINCYVFALDKGVFGD